MSHHSDHLPDAIREPLASVALDAIELSSQLGILRNAMLRHPSDHALVPYLEQIMAATLADLNTSIAAVAQSTSTYIAGVQASGSHTPDFQAQVDSLAAIKDALDQATAAIPASDSTPPAA